MGELVVHGDAVWGRNYGYIKNVPTATADDWDAECHNWPCKTPSSSSGLTSGSNQGPLGREDAGGMLSEGLLAQNEMRDYQIVFFFPFFFLFFFSKSLKPGGKLWSAWADHGDTRHS